MPDGRLGERPLLHNHPLAWRLSLVLWVVGGLPLLGLAFDPTAELIRRIDTRVWEFAVDLETELGIAVAEVFDFIGSSWVTVPIMVVVGAYLIWRRHWESLWFWVISMTVSQFLIGPIKALYARPRPPLPLVPTSGYSFPSGHAVAGAAIAVSLVIVLVPAGPERRNLEILAVAFAGLMALSRVFLRAHWLSDVGAGGALGVAVAVGVAALIHYADDRRRDPRRAGSEG
jgi:undecaprenyl-diphosphatase